MAINKNQLVFDPADDANSDSVGAYVRSSDGTLITHTTNGAKEALDVNIAASSGGITIIDSDGDELDVQPDGSINVNASLNDPIKFRQDGAVVEVLEDTVTPANNQPLPVKLTGLTGDINVTAGDLNVQLTHTGANPDSTQIGDGTTIVGVTADTHMKVADYMNSGLAASAVSVDTTAGGTQLVSSALANRKYLEVQNNGNKAIYLGLTGVTSSTGLCIPAKSSWTAKVGPSVDMYAISSSGTVDVRVLELA